MILDLTGIFLIAKLVEEMIQPGSFLDFLFSYDLLSTAVAAALVNHLAGCSGNCYLCYFFLRQLYPFWHLIGFRMWFLCKSAAEHKLTDGLRLVIRRSGLNQDEHVE